MRKRTNLIGLGPQQIKILDDLVQGAIDDPALAFGTTNENWAGLYRSLNSLDGKIQKAKWILKLD